MVSAEWPCRRLLRKRPLASIATPTTMGINGLGCIGRLALRAAITNLEVEVQAAGDPFMDLKFMIYQVKYGSMHEGGFPGTIVYQPPCARSPCQPLLGINGCGRIGRLVDALPSPTHRLRSRQKRSFHGHVAHGLPDNCSSAYVYFPGTQLHIQLHRRAGLHTRKRAACSSFLRMGRWSLPSRGSATDDPSDQGINQGLIGLHMVIRS